MYYILLLINIVIFTFFTNITFPGVTKYIFFLPSLIITFIAFALYIIAVGAYGEFISGLKLLLSSKIEENNKKLKMINKFYKSMCFFGLLHSLSVSFLHLLLSNVLQNGQNYYLAFTYMIYYVYIAIFIIYPIINKTSSYRDKSTD